MHWLTSVVMATSSHVLYITQHCKVTKFNCVCVCVCVCVYVCVCVCVVCVCVCIKCSDFAVFRVTLVVYTYKPYSSGVGVTGFRPLTKLL